jgi:hypothetical protein
VFVLLRFTASDYPFGIFKLFLSLFPSATVSVLLRFKSSDYTFGIFELFLSPFLLAIVLSVLRFTASAYLSPSPNLVPSTITDNSENILFSSWQTNQNRVIYIVQYLSLFTTISRSEEVYSIQHFVIKCVSDLLRLPPPIKLTATIKLKYC